MKRDVPLVSVIVPTFNIERYIKKCLDSLLSQTLKEIEIICIDDGSTDTSGQILDEYATKDSRIKVIHRINGGLSAARNTGLSIAQGQYIGFVDGDDWVNPQMFQELSKALIEHPLSDIAICGVETIFEYDENKKIKKGYDKYFNLTQRGEHRVNSSIIKTSKPCWNKLYRHCFLKENNIVFPEGMNNEDEAFHYFVFTKAKFVTFVEGQWYKYMRYSTGIIADQWNSFTEDKKLPDYITKVWPLLIEYVKRDLRFDILNDMVTTLLSKANSFKGKDTDMFISSLLRRLDYPLVADYLDFYLDSALRKQLQYYYDLNSNVTITKPDHSLLPKPPCPIKNVKTPLFSFVVPVFNSSQYLLRSIESMRNQTIADIEIICVNDGSTDNSFEILSNYTRIDQRIKIITQENRGTFVARKVGTLAATGKYVIYVDPDDWVDVDICNKIDVLLKNQDVDIVQYGIATEQPNSSISAEYVKSIQKFFDSKMIDVIHGGNEALLQHCFLTNKLPWNNCGKAIRSTIAKDAFSRMPDIKCNFAEDQIAMFYIFSFSKTLLNIKDHNYHYRLGTGISTQQKETIAKFDDLLGCFVLYDQLKTFVSKFFVPTNEIANNSLLAIHHSMMDNMWKRIIHNAEKDDIDLWLSHWCEKASSLAVVKYLIQQFVPDSTELSDALRNKVSSLEQKVKKRLKTIRTLIWLSSLLLLSNIVLLIMLFA